MSNSLKRIIAVMITLTMMVGALPISVFSAGTETSSGQMLIVVSSTSGMPEDTVEIVVKLENNPGLASLKLDVNYDAFLTLKSVSFNEAFGPNVTTPEPYSNPQPLAMISPLQAVDADGVFAVLTFEISKDAPDNYQAEISISYDPDEIYDDNYENISVAIQNGIVRVYHGLPGDVNEDGIVSTKDAVLLFRYIAGWNVDVDSAALDTNGDNKINTKDAVQLFRYVAGWPDIILYYGEICHCELVYQEGQKPTCTETGLDNYWKCKLCNRIYGDADGKKAITLNDLVLESTGHTYSQEWSTDATHHWHMATCGHSTLISDNALHSFDENKNCSICGYNNGTAKQLATPVITRIDYDTVYWSPVDGADYYTVRVNDNYVCTLRGTECDLADVKNNGTSISKHGYVRVEVRANGYTSEDGDIVYKASNWSATNNSYYYVPETISDDAKTATRFRIGHGYNLVESPYLDTKNYASTNSVLNVNKLLTIGEYNEAQGTLGEGTGYSYETIDDFLSKTELSAKYGQESSSLLIGSLKFQLEAGLNVNYRKYQYCLTYTGSSNVVYNDRRIINFEKDNLKYCMSDIFLKDVRRESAATRGMSDEQLMAYLYTTYGTHVILGVNTGGSYQVQYTVFTNKEEIAHAVKLGFGLSTGGAAVDQVIEKNFNFDAQLQQTIENNTADTTVYFTTYFYGGNGPTTTDRERYTAAKESWKVDENTASAIGLTQDGAIAISSLISYVDYDLAMRYEEYIDERADDLYDDLYAQYTMPADLKWDVTTENGENVLRIDLSAYQKSGSMENVYSPYMYDNIMTVHPVMAGKEIHKIIIAGAFDEAESRNLIDNFSIVLSEKWNRNVNVVIENLGVICASDMGVVDTSALRNNIKVNVQYVGNNVIQQTNGEYQVFAGINSETYSFAFNAQEGDSVDLSAARIEGGNLYLPQLLKSNYEFGGWLDANGLQVTDSQGKLNLDYVGLTGNVRVYTKWNPLTYKVTLNNEGANTAGTTEFFELYNEGFYLEYEGINKITVIPELPQRTGFVFKGYYTGVDNNATAMAQPQADAKLIIDESGNIMVTIAEFTRNTMIYALWVPAVFTVTLDHQGADQGQEGSTMYYEKYVSDVYLDEDCTLTGKITVPVKDGYTFMGYYERVTNNGTAAATGYEKRIDADGTIIASASQYTADTVLYALWTEPRYEVKFENQNADVAGTTVIYQKTDVGFYQDVNCEMPVPSNKIAVPQKTGYTFGGYYDVIPSNNNTPFPTVEGMQYVAIDGTLLFDASSLADHITLYAMWDLDEFTITWGSIANATVTVTRKSSRCPDAKIGLLSSGDTIYYWDELEVTYKANTGYHFEVNGNSDTYIQKITVKKSLTAADITISAVINKYKITYDGNNGTASQSNETNISYGTTSKITVTASRHGWNFVGWNTKADGSGTTYTSKQSNWGSKHGDEIKLYAIWKIDTSEEIRINPTTFSVHHDDGLQGCVFQLSDYFDMDGLIREGYTRVTVTQTCQIKATEVWSSWLLGQQGGHVCNDIYFDRSSDGTRGAHWDNSPSETKIKYTNMLYFESAGGPIDVEWSRYREFAGRSSITVGWTTNNPYSFVDNYWCDYEVSNWVVTISFS